MLSLALVTNSFGDEQGGVADIDGCFEACARMPGCLQYRFDTEYQRCTTSTEPKLGEAEVQRHYYSGWMYDRIER